MADEKNPYEAPQSDLISPETAGGEMSLHDPERRGIGDGWHWIAEGFDLFKQAPGPWIGMFIVFFIILMVMGFIPFIGSIAGMVLSPVFMAGFMLGCRSLDQGDGMAFDHLFAGFKNNTAQLVLIGVIYIVLCIIAMVPMLIFSGGFFMEIMANADNPNYTPSAAAGGGFAIGILITLAIYVPVIMAYWFAPALVSLHNQTAMDAMKMSFKGCLRNVLPFLWYGIIAIVLYIVAALPLLLGLIVLIPVLIASMYASYRSIFIR